MIEEFEGDGMMATVFARRHRLNYSTFAAGCTGISGRINSAQLELLLAGMIDSADDPEAGEQTRRRPLPGVVNDGASPIEIAPRKIS